MKNVTVSVPDEVYRTARVRAAERGSSVSALVKEFLTSLSSEDAEFARLHARQNEILDRLDSGFAATERLTRDEVHDRALR